MKLRYWIGIPYLIFIWSIGGNIIFDAMVIGILAGFTDMIQEGGGPHLRG
tara:strand:+ start:491 stop:640 length:150 start_codon:yes stop_codon:yes gene_type:complete